jgi:hypothetical protein
MRKDDTGDAKNIEHEILSLNSMLQKVEASEGLYVSYELIDLNKFKIINKQHLISQALKLTSMKPFEFLINKN